MVSFTAKGMLPAVKDDVVVMVVAVLEIISTPLLIVSS
jgi:hypothetical protein